MLEHPKYTLLDERLMHEGTMLHRESQNGHTNRFAPVLDDITNALGSNDPESGRSIVAGYLAKANPGHPLGPRQGWEGRWRVYWGCWSKASFLNKCRYEAVGTCRWARANAPSI